MPVSDDPVGEIPMAAPVADAPPGNWVDLYAPAFARPYLRLSRADRPIGTWLLFLPCLWGTLLAAAGDPAGWKPWDGWIIAGCALGAFLMRGAGCTWNDISDREIDAQVARTRSRPIPSGQVSARGALIWMVAQGFCAFFILISYNFVTIALGVASLALVAIYPFAKRFTWWPQVFLGLAFNWGALVSGAAHSGSIDLPMVLLYLSGIAWTLFYDTIYAHQDREDDALIGVKSTARLFGGATRIWLRGFMVAAVVLMAAAVVAATLPLDRPLALVLGVAGAWAFGWHLSWQLGRLDIDDPALCMRLFRSNRNAGLLPALFLAAALWV
jgi:4-hydroxybenzoate polyprenyltransferase